jgi:radical SAM superfamily enzyme YgiQ (UPF0313 family)
MVNKEKLDILLVTIAEINRPYMMGVATLKAYLKTQNISSICTDPVNEYMQDHLKNENYDEGQFLSLYNPDSFSFVNPDHSNDLTSPSSPEEKGIANALLKNVEQNNPRFIGFSLIAGNIFLSLMLAKFIKSKYPQLPIILGGCAFADKLPFDYEQLEFIDYFVYGDGEENIVRILCEEHKSLISNDYQGLSFKYLVDNKVNLHENKTIYFQKNQETFYYPDFSDFERFNYYKEFFNQNQPLTFSRGCPYRCTFCNVKQFSYRYTLNPVSHCIEEVKKYTNSGINQFMIVDSIINGNPKWLTEFCDQVIQEKLQIKWMASFRLQSPMKKIEYFHKIVDAGCELMIIGLESGSHQVLKDMKKYYNLDSLDQIFTQIREFKKNRQLRIYLQLIIGYPTETEKDFNDTLNFIFKHVDVIDEVATASVFMMLDDFKEAYNKTHNDLLYHRSAMDWETKNSTPLARLNRANKLERLLKKLNIPYHMYYKEKIQTLIDTD